MQIPTRDGSVRRKQIRLFYPTLGKVKIADQLARAGIHIGKTTVERILKEKPVYIPDPTTDDSGRQCPIVSKYPGHTWHADLSNGGADLRRLLDELVSQCNLAAMARMLVGPERDRSFFAAVHGMRRDQVPNYVGGSDSSFGSHHV